MLEWVLDRLPPEIRRVIVAVNWKAQALGTYLATRQVSGKARRVEFVVVKEDQPLGTAGAVKNCQPHLTSHEFLVLNADIVSAMDISALIQAHRTHKAAATISLKEVEASEVIHYGVIKPAGQPASDGAIPVADFVEKPRDASLAPSRLINAGAYVLNRSVLDLIPTGKLVSLEKEIFPQLLPRGFWGVPFDGHWIDVGDAKRLLQACAALDPQFKTGLGSRVAATATFANSVAGRDCAVQEGAHVTNSILGDGVTIASNVRLTDCVVGDGEFVRANVSGERVWTKPVPEGYPDRQIGNRMDA
jgi:mannose-1-phosphate guanylyltransferase